METSTILTLLAPISGAGFGAIISIQMRKFLVESVEKSEAQHLCLEEARRLLLKGAPDRDIIPWVDAAKNPKLAKKLCKEGLYGYGLTF